MGICVTDNSKYIVTELMSGNSLQHAIHKLRGDSEDVQLHKSMPLSKKIDILTQVVQGLVYLHNLSPPLLHRDIKPSYVLLITSNTC
jgi:serine/threonine protein kinase